MPDTQVKPAYSAFLDTQNRPSTPFGLLFQSEHSKLAGALARAFTCDFFGDLNPDVIAAIAEHDFGWDCSDREQLERLSIDAPHSFTEVCAEDTLPCWAGSIAHGRTLSPLAEALISRHCCLLGTGSGKHGKFIEQETKHRLELEAHLPFTSQQFDCWTGALGFCDLLSLLLCSGSQATVSLPLAHPELRLTDRSVTLRWIDGQPSLSEPMIEPAVSFQVHGHRYNGTGLPLEPLSCEWSFVSK